MNQLEAYDLPLLRRACAELRWVSAETGGRSRVPPGSPYATVATFAEVGNAGRQWSLVCTFDEQDGKCTAARVHFLLENAPHHLLRPGAAFELREGKWVVTRGTVERIVAQEPVSKR